MLRFSISNGHLFGRPEWVLKMDVRDVRGDVSGPQLYSGVESVLMADHLDVGANH
jgi:hypothetical protein